MLKGYIFKEQIFQNEICALIFNEYLNNSNGIFGNYKNAMAVTSSGSNVTVASGVGIIQGRAIGEDSSTTIDAGTDSMYCKLVVEIDLDKVNTSSDFLQASYQIVKSASAYPALTQDNIIGTNSGKYQYELARFRTTSGGIVEFQDMRTFIDIPTMYEQVADMVQDAIDSIEDGSAFITKNEASYSTSAEINTGKKWINGKDIYRITFTGSNPTSEIGINISDLLIDDFFVDLINSNINWKSDKTPKRWCPLIQTTVSRGATSEPNVGFYQSEVFADDTKTTLHFNFGKNMTIYEWNITIEYTKTTD